MYYFIPFLERNNPSWQANIVPWYRTPYRLEFDDILHQIRIFKRQELESKMLWLTYHPHLRYLLHRQDLLESDVFSVFDAIQNIENEEMHPLQLKDLTWDEDCDFIYTPFVVVVKQQGELYAHIEYGSEGFISYITYFKDNQVDFICYFDDRGFLSSLVEYEDQRPATRYYYNAKGQWQLRENLQGEEPIVKINPAVSYRFGKLVYDSIDEVIWEFLATFLNQDYEVGDSFVLAAHTKFQNQLLEGYQKKLQKL